MQQVVEKTGIVPVIVLESADQASPLADALVAGNLPIMEITLRSEAGLDGIRNVAERSDVLVGAGTVLNVDMAKQAIQAGARFIVSPGLDQATVVYCQQQNVPIFPGVCTPSEVQQALNLGLDVLKFFPAEAYGGAATLKALSGPFPMARFLPTGGIHLEKLPEYARLPAVVAVGGSWMVQKDLIREKQFDQIQELAAQAVAAFAANRT